MPHSISVWPACILSCWSRCSAAICEQSTPVLVFCAIAGRAKAQTASASMQIANLPFFMVSLLSFSYLCTGLLLLLRPLLIRLTGHRALLRRHGAGEILVV